MHGYVVHTRIEKENGYTAGFTAEQFGNFLSGAYWKGVAPGLIYPDCFTHFLWLPQSSKGPVLKGKGETTVIENKKDRERIFKVYTSFKATKRKFTDGIRKYTLKITIDREFRGDENGTEKIEIKSGIYSPHDLLDTHMYDSLSQGKKECSFFHIIERKGKKFEEETKIIGVTDEFLEKNLRELIDNLLGYDERFLDTGSPRNIYFKYVEVKKTGTPPHPLYNNVKKSVFIAEKSIGNHPNQKFHKIYITDHPFEVHEAIIGRKERISILKRFKPADEALREIFKNTVKELHSLAKEVFK